MSRDPRDHDWRRWTWMEAHALTESFDTTNSWMGTQHAPLLTIALVNLVSARGFPRRASHDLGISLGLLQLPEAPRSIALSAPAARATRLRRTARAVATIISGAHGSATSAGSRLHTAARKKGDRKRGRS